MQVTVTLKFKGFSEAPLSALNPYSKTAVANWEIEDEMPWYDTKGEFDKVIHQIEPVLLKQKPTFIYERILDGSTN